MKLELRTLPLVLLFTIVGASSPLIAQTRDDTTVYNEELQIVHFEDFDYPAEARRTGVEGVVVIGATLNAQGQVIDATVVSGPRLLVPETLANARKWRFSPSRVRPTRCKASSRGTVLARTSLRFPRAGWRRRHGL